MKTPEDHVLQFFGEMPKSDKTVNITTEIRRLFIELALKLDGLLPSNPEKTVTLRKLLESAESATRAVLAGNYQKSG